jgi:DNA primase
LVKKGYKIEEIAKTGLLVEKDSDSKIPDTKYQTLNTRYYDRFRDRIMFPVQDIMGRVVGYSARVAPGGDEKTAKYVNTPQTVLYDKSNVLYGLHLAKMEIKKKGEAILVEGNTDVIASHQAGFPNTIAVSGTALTPEQVKIIKRYADDLKMAYDMDAAGQAAAKRSIRICLEGDLNVKIVLLSAGKDAADTLKEEKDVWKEALEKARGVIEYYFQDAFSRHDAKIPAEKKRIAKDLLNVMKDIADPVEKAHWVKELSRRLDIGEKVLLEVLEKAGEKKERKFSTESQPEPVAEAGRDKILEKRIIGLALAFPKETEKRRILVNVENFSGEERKIFEEILKDAKAGLVNVKQNIF